MYYNCSRNLWGEHIPQEENEWDKRVPKELGKLVILSAIKPEFPKQYKPLPDETCYRPLQITKELVAMDDTVVDTVKLLHHSRFLCQLIDVASKEGEENISEKEKIKNCNPVFPEITEKKVKVPADNEERNKFHTLQQHELSPFASGKPVEQPRLCQEICKALLKKSVATLVAHAGFESAMESALMVLTDIAEEFFTKLMLHLRYAVDDEILNGSTVFPDVVEQVYHKMGLGSIRSLENYYRTRVSEYKDKVFNECQQLSAEYQVCCALMVVDDSSQAPTSFDSRFKEERMDESDIPEIHFPGDMDGSGLDDLQPSLHTEYQMLGKLEQHVQALQCTSGTVTNNKTLDLI